MKYCGRHNVRKHREINNSEKYITLNISLDFGILEKIKITRTGKGLINSMGIKSIRRSKKIKKERFYITNDSLKDLSKIIKEFEDLSHSGYVRNRSKQILTDSYFYLSR